MRLPRRPLVVFTLLLAACSKDPPKPEPAKDAPTMASAAPSAAPAAPAATSASPAAAAPASAAPVAAPAAAKPPASPEPELKEWDATKADLNVIKNWSGPGCMARRVREWVRIGCAGASTQKGAPVSIEITKGFPSSKYSVLTERAGSMMLVFPATEGLDAEATFTFAEGAFRLKASWPAGQPEPKAIGAFETIEQPVNIPSAADPEPGGSPDETAPAPAPAAPKLEKAVVSTDPLPELPVVEGAPTAEQWTTAKEVGVKGSDALGCETKQIGEWFRVVCRSNNNTGKVTAATSIRGFDAKDVKAGYLVTGNGAMVLLMKYVKGTDVAIDITWEKTVGRLNLKWPDTLAIPPALRGELVSRG